MLILAIAAVGWHNRNHILRQSPHDGGAHRGSPEAPTLEEVLSIATRPEQPTKGIGYDVARRDALRSLELWPKVSVEDEVRIAAAFDNSLHEANGNYCSTAAVGLGRRGHTEAIPTIIELGQKDPNLINSFFVGYTRPPKGEIPVELLRSALHSKNPDTRAEILKAIASCRAVTLRTDVEEVLENDNAGQVIREAALTLRQFQNPASAAPLRRVFARDKSPNVASALIQLGNDADVISVLPLLKSKSSGIRDLTARGLCTANLIDSKPACDALLESLRGSRALRDYRIDPTTFDTLRALGHFRETRAIPILRDLLKPSPDLISNQYSRYYVDPITAIGGPEAIKLLEDMVQMGYRAFDVEKALVHFASPSSGRVVWEEYQKHPICFLPNSDAQPGGYLDALDVLAACADAEVLSEIRKRARLPMVTTSEYLAGSQAMEKDYLEKLIPRIQARLNGENVNY